ncbi:hypothetical protein EB796_004676 [Bugula neritina]|uniref:MICOS complex subunit n=1 Tax=Bugula neritina TaxID=10212 RepID=A0A7J7KFL0_BUGNE|nr:hypothetical protein EB796_004676 [Bugula neritina]
MGSGDGKESVKSLTRNINLPLYDDHDVNHTKSHEEVSAAVSAVESCVRSVRMKATGVLDTIDKVNSNVTTKYYTAKAHTNGVLDFFRDEPSLWQRCGIVAVAGLTGFISGYRRGGIVKTRNMLLAAGAAGAVCWPKETVETVSMGYNYVKEPVVKAWTEYAPGSSYWPTNTATTAPPSYYSHRKVAEDHGQSRSEDRDMYSTRGS